MDKLQNRYLKKLWIEIEIPPSREVLRSFEMANNPFRRPPGSFTDYLEFQTFLNISESRLDPIDQLTYFLTHSASDREVLSVGTISKPV